MLRKCALPGGTTHAAAEHRDAVQRLHYIISVALLK
jgi:hypothetical protein